MSSRTDQGNAILLLGVDGGGTRCRARLADLSGVILGQGLAGPANIRLGLQQSLAAVTAVTSLCLEQAGLNGDACKIIACLALAGACEPSTRSQAQASPLPFYRAMFTSDARAACVGAHAGRDGAIIIVGTGSVGWGIVGGREFRVGGWGFPLSNEGSGAWLGCELLRQVLRARDGLTPWTGLLRSVFQNFQSDAHSIVRWMGTAGSRDYASLAPIIVAHAEEKDEAALHLMKAAGAHVDAKAERLRELGAVRMSLMGGLRERMGPYVSDQTRARLVPPLGDALSGALRLARAEAVRLHPDMADTHV